MAQAAAPKQSADILDEIAAKSAELRVMAAFLDDLALRVEAERQRAQAETTKFRQLQALLRDG